LKEQRQVEFSQALTGARGHRRASRNHEAVVFPWEEAGPQAFRPPLRNPFLFRR